MDICLTRSKRVLAAAEILRRSACPRNMAKRSRGDSESRPRSEDEVEVSPTSPNSEALHADGPSTKFQSTSPEPESVVMYCDLPPHKEPERFKSYEQYEVHYRQVHANRCVECNRNFPSEHFLNVHIGDNHDPLTASRRDRGEKTVSLSQLEYRAPSSDFLLVYVLCRGL